VPTVDDLARYLRPDELTQAFYFDLLQCPWDAAAFGDSVRRGLATIAATGASMTWTLANHDVHRAVTRYGLVRPDVGGSPDPFAGGVRARGEVDVALGARRSRASLLLVLGLPGSVYLYQGEELGLPEVLDLPAEARQDPIFRRSGGLEFGRDGCRVPLPWRPDGPTFGFSEAADPAVPWLPQPEWFGGYAVEAQWDRPDSTLRLNAEALRLRRSLLDAVRGAPVEWLPVADRPDVLAYRRGPLTVVTVFGDVPYAPPAEWGSVALRSESALAAGDPLPGDSAAWLTT
jgi:alpha-glucosidase